MGSSRSEYNRDIVTWDDLKSYAEKMAWKRSGFENREALKNHVRSLSLEERLDLLTEHHIDDLSKIYLKRRQTFMENLGQSICVTRTELLEYAARVYPSFRVEPMWVEDQYIRPDELSMNWYRKKR